MFNKYTLPILFAVFVISFFVAFYQSKVTRDEKLTCSAQDFTGFININDTVAIFDGKKIVIPDIAYAQDIEKRVLGVSNSEKWIDVDLSEQKLRAWEGNTLYLETALSSGLPWWPTPKGEFRIWTKLRATKMEGGSGKYYYNLPNVPYVMFFENVQTPGRLGYGLHGAYWHNDFGTPRSHGCVNLPVDVAGLLYYWVDPVIPEGKTSIRATAENPGTRIVIHE